MSVLIKGMEMPDDGYICLKVFANGDVVLNKVHRGALVITGIKDKVGTAVPVPPHGRLIDADALLDGLLFPSKQFEQGMRELIGDAPTVVPAEETLKEATNDQNNS